MQMVDVHLPTTDGRQLVLPRYTQPDPDHQLLFQQLKLSLPAQPLSLESASESPLILPFGTRPCSADLWLP